MYVRDFRSRLIGEVGEILDREKDQWWWQGLFHSAPLW
jgi:hypothetical protein